VLARIWPKRSPVLRSVRYCRRKFAFLIWLGMLSWVDPNGLLLLGSTEICNVSSPRGSRVLGLGRASVGDGFVLRRRHPLILLEWRSVRLREGR